MCGIVGYVNFNNSEDLFEMISALKHRGPDAEGYYIDEKNSIYLGHTRLSIIDIQHGRQPMWDKDKTIGIIFNGEIYNHLELRKELQYYGHIFQTDHSDTEVLIHGYKQWGKDLPIKINGMFAFAIYDIRNKKLFLARDRFGKKPLYYTRQGNSFIFASELNCLLLHRAIKTKIDLLSLQKLFAYGFIPAPKTLYKNIFKLPGGHSILLNLNDNSFQNDCYWKFSINADKKLLNTKKELLAEELKFLLSQSIKRRLISDVPVGFFLSGGIDSSIICLLAAEFLSNKLDTFTIGFDEPTFDESKYAKKMADFISAKHHEKILNLNSSKELISQILSRLDEPICDPSILPTYLVSEFASQYVKVILTGDGGDELFAGYDPFKAVNYARIYHKIIPSFLHRKFIKLVDLLPLSHKNMSLDFKLKRTLRGLSYNENLWHPIWLGPIDPEIFQELFNQPININEIYSEVIQQWENTNADNLMDKSLEFYTRFYLPENILTKIDRASMMTSLEVRSPFLDNDVVSFSQKLPYQFKYHKGTTKYLLKYCVKDRLPKEIVKRKKKGFGIPISSWLKTYPSKIPYSNMPDINMDTVKRFWLEHRSGKVDHRQFMWLWLVLQSRLFSANKEVTF